MFQALQPLVAERSVHILISASKDGRLSVYVEPRKIKDDEDVAFVTPFHAQATAAELDEQLPAILTQWVASRQASNKTLVQQLADAEAAAKAAADEAKKKFAEKHKKPTVPTPSSKPAVKVEAKPATPSLLDDLPAAPAVTAAPAVVEPVVATTAENAPATVEIESTSQPAPVAAPVEIAPVVTTPAAATTAEPTSNETVEKKDAPKATIKETNSTKSTTPDLWG